MQAVLYGSESEHLVSRENFTLLISIFQFFFKKTHTIDIVDKKNYKNIILEKYVVYTLCLFLMIKNFSILIWNEF